ncbi:hypothetical protein [Sphingomonas radiodurans]|uniref:hypothetical protein n=1 Tax=Sphingomonas radiodurans TaxID=2890321 RepID=UPI001E64F81E|nr:hypothetical protein [Sphingomonas radiodurans]WBH15005.1 hypothetical protein LLW23_08980 [Sphingomonas radiodurans]
MGAIACGTGAQAALNRDLVPAVLLLMTALVSAARLIAMQRMRQTGGPHPRDLLSARRRELGYGLGSCITSLLLGITNLHVLSYRDPALTLLVVCGLCCYVFSLILRTAIRPIVCLPSIMLALVPTIIGLMSFLDHGTRLDPTFTLLALATIAIVLFMASVQLTRHLYQTTLDQLVSQRDLMQFARRDPLTGLNNRLALREHFDTLFRGPVRPMALSISILTDSSR